METGDNEVLQSVREPQQALLRGSVQAAEPDAGLRAGPHDLAALPPPPRGGEVKHLLQARYIQALLCSHWSRSYITALSLVESSSLMPMP